MRWRGIREGAKRNLRISSVVVKKAENWGIIRVISSSPQWIAARC